MTPTIQCAVVFLMVSVSLITSLYHTSSVASEPISAAKPLLQQLIMILSQYQKTVRMTVLLLYEINSMMPSQHLGNTLDINQKTKGLSEHLRVKVCPIALSSFTPG